MSDWDVKCEVSIIEVVWAADTVQTHYAPSGHCYQYLADVTYPQRTYSDSRVHCQSVGGDLVVINDQEENNIIKDHVYVTGLKK